MKGHGGVLSLAVLLAGLLPTITALQHNQRMSTVVRELGEAWAPLPGRLSVAFPGPDGLVTLALRRNTHIDHNMPVTFEDGSTVPGDTHMRNVGVYHDYNMHASISVTVTTDPSSKRQTRTLEGSFIHKGHHYIIEPADGASTSQGHDNSVPHTLIRKDFYIPETRGKHSPVSDDLYRTDDFNQDLKGNPSTRRMSRPFVEQRAGPPAGHDTSDRQSPLLQMLRAHSRRRREVTVKAYSIETMVVLDHTIWERFRELAKGDEAKTLRDIKYYYSHIINGVDLAYSSIDPLKHGISINVWLKGYHIAKTRNESIWTVPHIYKNSASGSNKYRNIGISGTSALQTLARWHNSGGRTWFNPDHFFLFTRYNISLSTTIGLAGIASICTPSGNALVEDIGFHSWFTAAHEMGHNLGAMHDGIHNVCPSGKRHVMAPSAGFVESANLENVFTFSNCSISEMKNTLVGTNPSPYLRMPRVCMHNRLCEHVEMASDVSTLPGQRYNATEQCQVRFGPKSATCGTSNVCLHLSCRNQNGVCKTWRPGAADGTPCGNDKWCHRGRCVEKQDKTGSSNVTCTETSLEVPAPPGCYNTPGYQIKLLKADNSFMYANCEDTALGWPHLCFYSLSFSINCCGTCYRYGLVEGNYPEIKVPTPPVPSSTTAASTTSQSPTCFDSHDTNKCIAYKNSGDCENNWKDWMMSNCRATCGMCAGTTTAATPTTTSKQPTTTTTSSTTSSSTSSSATSSSTTTSSTTSSSTTSTATTTQKTTTQSSNSKKSACKDAYPPYICEDYKKAGDCGNTWEDWMRANCNKTCDFCAGTGVNTVTTKSSTFSVTTPAKTAATTTKTTQSTTTTTQSTTATQQPTKSSTNGKIQCVDEKSKGVCQTYKAGGDCTNQWRTWMEQYCASTCGFCKDGATISTSFTTKSTTTAKKSTTIKSTTSTTTTRKPTTIKPTTSTTTTRKPTTIKPTTTTKPACIDKYGKPSCEGWRNAGDCNNNWRSWMQINCPATCKLCPGAESESITSTLTPSTTTTTTTTTTTAPPSVTTTKQAECKDEYSSASCEGWKKQDDCTNKWKDWMEQNCYKTCGHCKGTPPSCQDEYTQCASWAEAGDCTASLWKAFMANNCKKACNICGTTDTLKLSAYRDRISIMALVKKQNPA